jgi:HSP20 family protein
VAVCHLFLSSKKRFPIHKLSIRGEFPPNPDVIEGEKLLRSERYYGSVWGTFSLARDVEESAAQANYADGVQELTLPKKKATSARKPIIQ